MNAPPLLKETLPRLPWPPMANCKVAMLDPPHGSPGSPPTPWLAPLAPDPTPLVTWKVTWRGGAGSLGGRLARVARLA